MMIYPDPRPPIYLIINADDCGYYSCVSKGLIECAKRKAINATGLMANGPNFFKAVESLQQVPELDVGVHLNITYGSPITSTMRKCLRNHGGVFQPAMKTAAMVLGKVIDISAIDEEWRAQLQKCISAGLNIRFLNSHEHVHMLPMLYDRYMEIAANFHIPYTRHTRPEWRFSFDLKSHFRNAVLHSMLMFISKGQPVDEIELIGTGLSCHLNIGYLENCLKKMRRGRVYELMCHPGYFDGNEISDDRIVRYHAWEKELRLLVSDSLKRLFDRYHVKLISFHDLGADQTKDDELAKTAAEGRLSG